MPLIENIGEMKEFAWAATIHDNLTSSLVKSSETPKKVKGCTVSLMYWLCEHTKLISPENPAGIPRFAKWNLKTLSDKLKTTPISALTKTEVSCGKLVSTLMERKLFIGLEEEPDNDNEDEEKLGAGANSRKRKHKVDNDLSALRNEYNQMVQKNLQLESKVATLEKEIDHFRSIVEEHETHMVTQQPQCWIFEAEPHECRLQIKEMKQKEQIVAESQSKYKQLIETDIERLKKQVESLTTELSSNPQKKCEQQFEPSSMVKRVKIKTRTQLQDPDFEYQKDVGKRARHNNDDLNPNDVFDSKTNDVCKEVTTKNRRKMKGVPARTRIAVGKLIPEAEYALLTSIDQSAGTSLLMRWQKL